MRTVWSEGDFRIVEVADEISTMDDLLGDCFNPKAHPEISADTLKAEEREERATIAREGVYGYRLERWNSGVGCGWEEIDSCYGFVGAYRKGHIVFHHYIVDEMIQTAKTRRLECVGLATIAMMQWGSVI
jgi:hypothetical protein